MAPAATSLINMNAVKDHFGKGCLPNIALRLVKS